jgi:hypothetical protein
MSGLTRTAKMCRECPFKDRCKNKRLEKEAYLTPNILPIIEDMASPVLKAHDYRNVKVSENTTITIDAEEQKERMRKEIYRQAGIGLNYGA